MVREKLRTAPAPFHPQRAFRLPQIVLEAEEGAFPTRHLLDALHCLLLLRGPRTRRAVRLALVRPAGFQIVRVLARTNRGQEAQLGGDKVSCIGRLDVSVEKRVDVRRGDVHDGTEGGAVFLQDVERFRGRDGALITCSLEGGFGARNKTGEGGCGAVPVEHGFVADHDHLHIFPVPVSPFGDFADLLLCGTDAGFGDEDPEHQFQAVRCGGRSDVLQAGTIGAVETDGGEAFGRNGSDVRRDGRCRFASTGGGIGGVGHAPLAST